MVFAPPRSWRRLRSPVRRSTTGYWPPRPPAWRFPRVSPRGQPSQGTGLSTELHDLVSGRVVGCRFSVVVADCQVSADTRQPITDNTELPDTLFRGAVLSEAADRIGRELCRWWRRAEHAPRRTVLQEAGRSARYSAVEIAPPAFDTHRTSPVAGTPPSRTLRKSLRRCHTGMSVNACFEAANCFAATLPLFAKCSQTVKSTFTPVRSGVRFRKSLEGGQHHQRAADRHSARSGDGRPRTRRSMASTGRNDTPDVERAPALRRTASGDSCAGAPSSAPAETACVGLRITRSRMR